jgi:DNA-binding response OmpR family regulator
MARVMVIEDDELARESITIILEEHGHEVTQAEDGDIGIELMKANP